MCMFLIMIVQASTVIQLFSNVCNLRKSTLNRKTVYLGKLAIFIVHNGGRIVEKGAPFCHRPLLPSFFVAHETNDERSPRGGLIVVRTHE